MPSLETLAPPARVRTVPLHAAALPGLNGNRPAVVRGGRRKRFSVDVVGVADLVVAAVNANNRMTSYSNALGATSIPSLPGTPPAWWTTFTNQWATVKSNAMVWTNSVSPQMTAIPEVIINSNHLFVVSVKNAQRYLGMLIHDPDDTEAQQSLSNALSSLSESIGEQQASVTAFTTLIGGFSTTLAADETTLQTAVQDALATADVDQAQVAKLARDVADLKHQIADYNQNIEAAKIGLEVSIYVGLAGAVLVLAGVGAGVILLGIGVIGVGVSIVGWVVNQRKVQEAQEKVSADTAAMSTLTQQAAVLSTLNTSLSEIISLSQAAQKYVKAIAEQWNVVQIEIDAVVADLNDAEADLSSHDYTAIQSDLNDATLDWGRLTDAVKGLADLTYNVSSTAVTITTS